MRRTIFLASLVVLVTMQAVGHWAGESWRPASREGALRLAWHQEQER
ncbi:MAG: hypothetical protein HQL38_13650 [Alphaproteobacteria bacterium]|nr:hypothetical protein [Alphaproteobacteria bacterium]MBF0393718.1 hypothetical protein [Alphaproteobacteria bacterium]